LAAGSLVASDARKSSAFALIRADGTPIAISLYHQAFVGSLFIERGQIAGTVGAWQLRARCTKRLSLPA
jgi:hypothetical protein